MQSTPEGSSARRARSSSYPPEHDDASLENDFPEVPYDDPAWDDPSTWELGSWLPAGAVVTDPATGFKFVVGAKGGRRNGKR